MSRWLTGCALFASACWTTEFPQLEESVLPFAPRGAEAPADWLVQAWPQGDMICPDGEPAEFWLVYPDPDVETRILPMAVVFHDDVIDRPQDAEMPFLSADREQSALTADHAARQVFSLLGMGVEGGSGALVAGLASAGHMVMLPSNCWGDLYANSIEGRANDATTEGFSRRGFDAAEFGFRMVSDNAWATVNRVELPQEPDYAAPVAIGLGHGGRAISELLAEEFEMPTAITDSSLDRTEALRDRADLFEAELASLAFIFADDIDAELGSLANTPVVADRTAYLWSRLDPAVPPSAHDGAVARLTDVETAWIQETGSTQHAPLADDADVIATVIDWIGEGVPEAP